LAMLVQTVVYLLLTILLDSYWYPISCACQRLLCSANANALWCFKRAHAQLPDVSNASLRHIIDNYISLANNSDVSRPEESSLLLGEVAGSAGPTSNYGSVDMSHLLQDESKGMDSGTMSRSSSSSAESLEVTGTRLNAMLAAKSTLVAAEEFGIFPVLETWMMPRPAPPLLLHARDLSVAYRKCDAAILKDLNIDIQQGERVALMGINGGGYVINFSH
jgi:hypothetical protein